MFQELLLSSTPLLGPMPRAAGTPPSTPLQHSPAALLLLYISPLPKPSPQYLQEGRMGNSLHSAPGDENRLPGLTVGDDGGLPLEKTDDHHAPLQRAAAVEAGLKEDQEAWVAASSWS